MTDETLVSYAQNGEDVVLWRALRHVSGGRYVDVGACDPVDLSVTKALYDRGWRGIDIDAVPAYVERLREDRPDNEVVHAAITDQEVAEVTFHELVGTGLSTLVDDTAVRHEHAGFERRDIAVPATTLDAVCEKSQVLGTDLHLLKIDVEGAEGQVLRSFDLTRWRPWVVVVEATAPLSTEPSYEEWDPVLTAAGYTFTLFDGISRFYVSPDHAELRDALSYPACALDDYIRVQQAEANSQLQQAQARAQAATAEVQKWRNRAVDFWADAVAKAQELETSSRVAQRRSERLRKQVAKLRKQLQTAQVDRRRLRDRNQRLTAQAERLQQRTEEQDRLFTVRARRKASRMLGKVRGS